MIVLDASAAIEWLLQTPAGKRVEDRILADAGGLHAPHLLDVEVTQALRRFVAADIVTASRGREAIDDLLQLSLTRYPHTVLVERMWELHLSLTAGVRRGLRGARRGARGSARDMRRAPRVGARPPRAGRTGRRTRLITVARHPHRR